MRINHYLCTIREDFENLANGSCARIPVQNAHNDTRYQWSKRYYLPHYSVYLIDNHATVK